MSAQHALLHRDGDPDLLRFTTAGSVDDGKSTLIGRLLHDADALYEDHIEALKKAAGGRGDEIDFSFITDGLKAEREQGITIDVAYRYFATAKRRFIIADTPGHEQYTRNMATGASTADLAVILIDARLGVLTQSKRHGFISSLLGVPRLVVAVNKMDLVGYDRDVFERIKDEYTDFATRLGFGDLTFIPVSALRGDNVVHKSRRMPWFDGIPLLTHLENVYVGGDRNLIDFRFPVQRVVRPDQNFRGYSGQIAAGVVRPGDEIVVLPSGKRSQVTRIVTYDGDLAYAFAPLCVTLCIADDMDISRGDMIVHPKNLPHVERSVEAMVVWMSDQPLAVGKTYLVKHGSAVVKGSCAEIQYRVDPDTLRRDEGPQLGLNDIGRARFSFFKPLFVDEYQRSRQTGSFIVIDPAHQRHRGGGDGDRPGGHRPGLAPGRAEDRQPRHLLAARQGHRRRPGPPAPTARGHHLAHRPERLGQIGHRDGAGTAADRGGACMLRARWGQHPARSEPGSGLLAERSPGEHPADCRGGEALQRRGAVRDHGVHFPLPGGSRRRARDHRHRAVRRGVSERQP